MAISNAILGAPGIGILVIMLAVTFFFSSLCSSPLWNDLSYWGDVVPFLMLDTVFLSLMVYMLI